MSLRLDLLCRAVARRGYDAVTFEPDEGGGWRASVDGTAGRREAWGACGAAAVQNLLMILSWP